MNATTFRRGNKPPVEDFGRQLVVEMICGYLEKSLEVEGKYWESLGDFEKTHIFELLDAEVAKEMDSRHL